MKRISWNWALGMAMSALYAAAIVLAFWRVLSPDVVFVAPDAPIEPLGFGDAARRLFTSAPTLQNLLFLLPYPFEVRFTVMLLAFSPVSALAPVFSEKCCGEGARSGLALSLSVVAALPCMLVLAAWAG